MTIENLNQKAENQANLIKELTRENEELYHQYNHLIIRNGKLLKRIDDFQRIINDLHIRIDELQKIHGNAIHTNERNVYSNVSRINNEKEKQSSEKLSRSNDFISSVNMDDLCHRWKNFPGQMAQNTPNIRKQILMLLYLYSHSPSGSADLFQNAGVGGVTGARYVSHLKKLGLICYTGARKKGHYKMTAAGIDFIENKNQTSNEKNDHHTNSRAKIFLENVTSKNVEVDHNDL